ncbi:hypothetical protein [Thermococcus zilligii]|uniref:hypothetical protein n=1 Tax=Thermococcus zilligii TaxID=54076 RepID=UPI000299FFED|nr:hypothetical protein [Thermococcus zilligii]
MSARDMRVEMFARAIMRGDLAKAKGHAEKLIKIAGDDEWGRGYSRAIEGIVNAINDNDTDSLIVQLLNRNDRERAKELLDLYSELAAQEFRDEYEKGYYTAWVEFLRAYLSQKTLSDVQ